MLLLIKCHHRYLKIKIKIKLNGRIFNGTVNFNEAKVKIFQVGLGLDTGLLSSVKFTFNKCPVVTLKLKSEINDTSSINNQNFNFERIYHSKGELKTDTIECKVLGVEPPVLRDQSSSMATSQMKFSMKPESLFLGFLKRT